MVGERKFCPDCGSIIFLIPWWAREFFCNECERVFYIQDMGVPSTERVAKLRALAGKGASA